MYEQAPSIAELARRIPKTDLHCHLIGTVDATTALELARRHGVRFPADLREAYAHINSPPPVSGFTHTAVPLPTTTTAPEPWYPLLGVSEWIADVLRDEEDFARVGYEAVAAANRASNVRHLELHFEVAWFLRRGVGYRTVVDGLDEGMTAAGNDFDVSSLLIAGLDRTISSAEAVAAVERVVAERHERVVGVGLDNLETAGPPERFAPAYRLARQAGLRRTAHAGEHVPSAANVLTCLDVLDCERIDHGYFVLEDPDAVMALKQRGTPVTCIFTTSRRSWRPWRRESIRRMAAAGLNVVLASDDPAMFPTTLADEYVQAVDILDLDQNGLGRLALAGASASWLDAPDQARLRRSFEAEIAGLLAGAAPGQGAPHPDSRGGADAQ